MRPIFVSFVLLAVSSFALADVVRLTNGDQITGTVTGLDSGELRLKTAYAGEIKIRLAAIEEISGEKPLHLSTESSSLEVHNLTVSHNELRTDTGDDNAISVAAKSVRELVSDDEYAEHERLLHAGLFELWSGSATAGFSAARGNSGATTLDVGMKADRVSAKDKLDVFFNSLFSDTSSSPAGAGANSISSGISYAVNVAPRLFTFTFANFETDALQHLDLRNVLGGGLGVNVVRGRHVSWNVFSGGSLDQELYWSQPTRRSGETLVGQELTHAPNSRMLLSERLTFFPNLSNPGEYRVAVESSTTLKLNSWLGWQVTFNDSYLSNPPAGAVNNDLLMSTGLRFSMGQEHAFQPRAKIADLLR